MLQRILLLVNVLDLWLDIIGMDFCNICFLYILPYLSIRQHIVSFHWRWNQVLNADLVKTFICWWQLSWKLSNQVLGLFNIRDKADRLNLFYFSTKQMCMKIHVHALFCFWLRLPSKIIQKSNFDSMQYINHMEWQHHEFTVGVLQKSKLLRCHAHAWSCAHRISIHFLPTFSLDKSTSSDLSLHPYHSFCLYFFVFILVTWKTKYFIFHGYEVIPLDHSLLYPGMIGFKGLAANTCQFGIIDSHGISHIVYGYIRQ